MITFWLQVGSLETKSCNRPSSCACDIVQSNFYQWFHLDWFDLWLLVIRPWSRREEALPIFGHLVTTTLSCQQTQACLSNLGEDPPLKWLHGLKQKKDESSDWTRTPHTKVTLTPQKQTTNKVISWCPVMRWCGMVTARFDRAWSI